MKDKLKEIWKVIDRGIDYLVFKLVVHWDWLRHTSCYVIEEINLEKGEVIFVGTKGKRLELKNAFKIVKDYSRQEAFIFIDLGFWEWQALFRGGQEPKELLVLKRKSTCLK